MFLTRAPLSLARPFDLHVLGTPPAFILSQDQTLHEFVARPCVSASRALRARLSHSSAVKVQNAQFVTARRKDKSIKPVLPCQPFPSQFLKLVWETWDKFTGEQFCGICECRTRTLVVTSFVNAGVRPTRAGL